MSWGVKSCKEEDTQSHEKQKRKKTFIIHSDIYSIVSSWGIQQCFLFYSLIYSEIFLKELQALIGAQRSVDRLFVFS